MWDRTLCATHAGDIAAKSSDALHGSHPVSCHRAFAAHEKAPVSGAFSFFT